MVIVCIEVHDGCHTIHHGIELRCTFAAEEIFPYSPRCCIQVLYKSNVVDCTVCYRHPSGNADLSVSKPGLFCMHQNFVGTLRKPKNMALFLTSFILFLRMTIPF